MRLVVSVKYLVGFVTAGSVAFLLSGSAWAAESPTNTVESGSLITVEAKGAVSVSQDISNVSVVEGSVSGTSSQVVSEPASVSVQAQVSPVVPVAEELAEGKEKASAGSVLPDSQETVNQVAAVKDAVTETLPLASAPVVEADASGRTVTVNEQALPMQPIIMSQATTVADLASYVPSAPASTHTPLPVKTTGVLFALTDHLASTIVPGLMTLVEYDALTIRQTLLNMLAVTLVVLLGGFAARLKQSGFVNAARSDVADGHLNFATPLGMGYVSLRLRTHSPFLMVSDTKSLEGNRS